MKKQRMLSYFLILIMVFSFIPTIFVSDNIVRAAPVTITITGNGDFTPGNHVTSGSGTSGDPYIIENLEIDYCNITGNASGDPIVKYFRIQNCTINEQIRIGYYVSEGRGVVRNCSSNDTDQCVVNAYLASGVLIENCNFSNNRVMQGQTANGAVYFGVTSHNCIVRNTTFDGYPGQYGTAPNWFAYGVSSNSNNNNNLVENCSFNEQYIGVIALGGDFIIRNSTFHDCRDEAVAIGDSNVLVEFCDFTGINTNDKGIEIRPGGTIQVTNVTIKNCTFDRVLKGISWEAQSAGSAFNVAGNLMENLTFTNSSLNAVGFSASRDFIMRECTVNNSLRGIELDEVLSRDVENITIYNNTITNCTEAINIEASSHIYDNIIYNNYFANNTLHIRVATDVFSYAENQTWNITKTLGTNIIGGAYLGGNYWDNYTGGDVDADGLGDSLIPFWGVDYHPLTASGIGIPNVTTNVTTGETETNATLQGFLMEDGNDTCVVGFQYGLTDSYGSTTTTENKTEGNVFSFNLSGLEQGSTWYYRAFATNTNSTVYGVGMNFTTVHNWSINLNCFNASDGSPILDWDLFVTNQAGDETYVNLSNNNPHLINISNGTCPVGTNIAFIFSKTNYTNRTYYQDISLGGNYTLNAYLDFYNGSELYLLNVINEVDQSVPDAKLSIKEYINETWGYQNITILYTDGNGQCNAWLTPELLHKVIITKEGYQDEESDYTPSSLIFTHTFRLDFEEEEPTEPYVESEEVTFEGYISGTTLYINYTDNLDETLDSQIYIYEVNYSTLTTTLHDSNTATTSDDYQITTTINISNAYIVYLHYNHTTFGYVVHSLYFEATNITPFTNQTFFDDLFDLNYGSNPFGWSNIFMWLFLCGCFFSFGQRGSGISLMFTGGLTLFINYVIGFNTVFVALWSGGIPILLIIVGIMVIWRNSKKEGGS